MELHLFRNLNLFTVELFLRCAELCNFRKAAYEYNITPGMVSKRISSMEEALNVALFSRKRNGVELTAAGKELYRAWKPLMNSFFQVAENIHKEQDNTISFTIWGDTNTEHYFVPLISSYSADERISFRVNMEASDGIVDLLLNGQTDIVFAPKFIGEITNGNSKLSSLLVLPSTLCAGFSEDNSLMKIKNPSVEDLKDKPILVDDNISQLYVKMLYRVFGNNGLVPNLKRIGHNETIKSKFIHLDEESVIITDRYHSSYHSNALEYRDLSDTESGIVMIYRRDASPYISRFIKYAKNFFLDFGMPLD